MQLVAGQFTCMLASGQPLAVEVRYRVEAREPGRRSVIWTAVARGDEPATALEFAGSRWLPDAAGPGAAGVSGVAMREAKRAVLRQGSRLMP